MGFFCVLIHSTLVYIFISKFVNFVNLKSREPVRFRFETTINVPVNLACYRQQIPCHKELLYLVNLCEPFTLL